MKKDSVKDIWNANAEFWDKRMGEGNDFQNIMLIQRTVLRNEIIEIKNNKLLFNYRE